MADPTPVVQPVTVNGREYRAVKEGLAQILAPYREKAPGRTDQSVNRKGNNNNDEGNQAVFYNPIQQYNRDLSVLAILIYGESALIHKEAIFAKKEKSKKLRNEKKNSKVKETDSNGTVHQNDTSKKRKAEEIQGTLGSTEEVNGNNKKAKTAEGRENEDDDMEVQQLEIDDEVHIVTGPAEEASEPKPDQSSTATAVTEPDVKQIPFTVLDALSASGLRAIRYAKEIPFVTNVIANDLSAEAVKSIELNIDHNQLTGRVHSNVGDARAYMYGKVGDEHRTRSSAYVHRFDVIDLDPYGTAAPFLDAAIQALADGGLLCVTCTDAGVFASNGYPEKAFALYGGVTMKGPFSHESGLRIILHSVASIAAKYGIAIEPLLSLSIDFYARLFIRVHKQPHQVKLLAGTTMVTYSCDFGCGAWHTQLLARNQERVDKIGQTIFKHSFAQGPSVSQMCGHCGSKMHLGGPMWAGPIHNPYFIQRILDKLPEVDTTIYQTTDRIKGMLTTALEEDLTLAVSNTTQPTTINTSKPADPRSIPRLPPQTIDATPFFFIPNYLSKVLHCSTPPEDQLRGAIRHLGYKVTRSHCKSGSFKTNAPWDVLWEIMREWIRQHAPVKEGKVTSNMPGWRIMQKLRNSESKNVMDVFESTKQALIKGVGGRDELKALLESGLYRLEHPKVYSEAAVDENGDDTRKVRPESPAWGEIRDVSKLNIVFDVELGKDKPRGKLVRYQINPRANWGPMNRAGGG